MRPLVSTDTSGSYNDDKDEFCSDKQNERGVKRKKNDWLGDSSSNSNSNSTNSFRNDISSSAFPPLNFAVKCKL